MHPQTEQSLRDVVDACREIEEYVSGVSLRPYHQNRRLQLTVERLIIIVGEALRRAERQEPAIVEALPHLRNILSMRHRIVHDYDAINQSIVWTAATRHSSVLRVHVESILSTRG